jgi:glycosyltransferase involved in cell wall biosynthesis
MKTTVIVCTFNRCDSLAKTLTSLTASESFGSPEAEILVVDNNSSDRTRATVESFIARFPGRFRYLFEPKQGKSHALNAGVHTAAGDLLAFTDDDVAVAPDWLPNLTASLAAADWAGAGGRILASPDFSPPGWLALDGPYGMGGTIGIREMNPHGGEFSIDPFDSNLPFGANMAFRREVFEKYGSFRTDLGAPPGNEIRGEDTEFCRRLLQAGERLRQEPTAVVYHNVPAKAAHRQYYLDWWFDYGRGLIRAKSERPSVAGIPRHYISLLNRIFRILPGRALRWFLSFPPQKRFFHKCWVWVTAGEIAELFRQRSPEGKEQSKSQFRAVA